MTFTQSSPLNILLDRNAHQYAQQFAKQATPAKGKQVYLNTLAVYALHTYLQCFGIKTNLAQSDCWHPGLRSIFNVADLVLPHLGKIECRWVLPAEDVVTIPTEVREDRLGYLVVRFEEELKQVELLGFISSKEINYATETININQLQSLDALFDTLDALQQQINLRQWLSGFFAVDWQPIETIMAGSIARSLTKNDAAVKTVSRGKVISWQVNHTKETVILLLKISESDSETIDLCLQLYPNQESSNLPLGLTVKIVDAAGETCLLATAKDSDDWMQLEFSCQPGEMFNVEMELKGITIVEKFLV